MQAAVLTGPRQAEVREVPVPEPKPGEVRIRLRGCGVCASNLATWEGMPWTQYPTPPGGLGHEGWGVVHAVGEGVKGLAVDQPVAFLGQNSYAEYEVAEPEKVLPLPRGLWDRAVPGEPLGCAFNVFERSRITEGETVCIVGIGFLGAIVASLAIQAGARVIAVARRPFAQELARRYGAQETVPMDHHWKIIERVRALTDGSFCDCVVEAVGKQWPLDLSAELTRERGRMVIAGYHQDGPRQVNMQLWNWRGLDVINAHERETRVYMRGMQAAVDTLARGQLEVDPLLTHSFPLSRIGAAFAAAENRPDGFLKGWITYE